ELLKDHAIVPREPQPAVISSGFGKDPADNTLYFHHPATAWRQMIETAESLGSICMKGVKRPKNKPPISKITPIQRNKLRALKVLALAKANGFFAAGVPYGFDPAEGQQDTDIVLLAPVGMPTSACQAIMRGATAIDGES